LVRHGVKPKGGYCLVQEGVILRLWAEYTAGNIRYQDVRAWLAAQEMKARRCTLGRGRTPSYTTAELVKLTGCPEASCKGSLARLAKCGLISWDGSAVTFPGAEGGDRRQRRLVPVPRRTLRFLAPCRKPALVATVLGHLARCMFFRNGECLSRGTCKASWVAETFGVDVRSVKAARKHLAAIHWLEAKDSKHWHRQRWGATVVVNLAWADPSRGGAPGAELPPPKQLSTAELPPPESDKELLPEYRYQKLAEERSGVKDRGPNIRNVRPEDLFQLSRTVALYRQAVALGLAEPSESRLLAWVAAAVRAKTAPSGDPVRIFMGIVRRGLWHHITQKQEDRARRALARYREVYPDAFRFAEEGLAWAA
jgi:hypothetical protein